MGDMDARVHIYTATALEDIGWLFLRLAVVTLGESPWYSIYRRLSGQRDQSGHEGVNKNLHLSQTQDRPLVI